MTAPVRRLPLVAPTLDTGFADFQNDVLAGTRSLDEGAPSDKAEQHEDAAHEKRNWVRLSYDCNNHCTFCLDSNAHDGTMRDNDSIKIQIVSGRKRGAERLILSGGEPTMHPNFLDFVRLGKRAGYRKVQTVTNGRMFAYPAFLERALEYGLDEITFSLHGHTAKLHDALVGTPGAFDEEVKGLRAALATGRFIVNIDIVINKQNVRHLPDMLETFLGWGVKEFDLLHVIPFGNAWSNARDHLFYDLDGNLPYLQRAFAYARRPDVHIWLNRFPAAYAEGFEDLIQDPYKLNDEVRGRREEYGRYLSHGEKLHCREPERCRRCYLEPLCDDLDRVLGASKRASVDRLRVAGSPPAPHLLPAAPAARVVASNLEEAAALVRELPSSATRVELELTAPSARDLALDALQGAVEGRALARVTVGAPELFSALFALPEATEHGPIELGVWLTRDTAPALVAMGELPARVVLVQPNYDRVTEARARDVDLPALFAALSGDYRVVNVPRCLSNKQPSDEMVELDTASLGRDARVDMTAFTQRFVADGFYARPLRCGSCAENQRCRGVHVNWARAHGFGALSPLARDAEGG